MTKRDLDPNQILCHEFEYAAQTAIQANEDRVRLFHYYLATAGTMIAASVLADFTENMYVKVFSLAMGALAILGFISVLKLVKLRTAWKDSVLAMCQIKKYYIENCDGLKEAFRWREGTAPAVRKKWSIAFLMTVIIAILSSASAGGAIYFWGSATGKAWSGWDMIIGSIWFCTQVIVWWGLGYLEDKKGEKEREGGFEGHIIEKEQEENEKRTNKK
ncbi:MAG: hypothetical protein HXS46_15350 [Theionarchaea archaeon]|nr:MAG: hypothetical protein AYK18_09965 [Theionarchaea archaeon DG-70]MBU7012059.1 hypothetical protein [Theionarchaea archaeon]